MLGQSVLFLNGRMLAPFNVRWCFVNSLVAVSFLTLGGNSHLVVGFWKT